MTREKHAPTKKKYIRANQALFVTKMLSKKIMKKIRFEKQNSHLIIIIIIIN